MKAICKRSMSPQQRRKLQSLLKVSVPELSFVEAKSAIQAIGTLYQGIYAAFEPFLRSPRTNSATATRGDISAKKFVLEVPYRDKFTIRHLLEAGGYDWMNADISDEHFPQRKIGKREITIHLANFRRVISTKDVLVGLKRRGLRPANPAELLAFGAKYPHIQKQFPIIALGQTWPLPNKDRLVVCLAWHSMLRRVHLLCQFRRDWPTHCRFVAIAIKKRKKKSKV